MPRAIEGNVFAAAQFRMESGADLQPAHAAIDHGLADDGLGDAREDFEQRRCAAPWHPMISTTSPRCTATLKSRNARTLWAIVYDLPMPRTDMAGVLMECLSSPEEFSGARREEAFSSR